MTKTIEAGSSMLGDPVQYASEVCGSGLGCASSIVVAAGDVGQAE